VTIGRKTGQDWLRDGQMLATSGIEDRRPMTEQE